MQYESWNFENDAIDTKQQRLFPENTARGYMGTAYAVETKIGIFYQKPRDDGKFNLMLVDGAGERVFIEDVAVVSSDMKYTCIIVHCNNTGEYFLIDTRGIFFLLEVCKDKPEIAAYDMRLDRKSGYYNVGTRDKIRWMIRSVSKKKQFMVMMESAPTGEWTINPKFKSIFSKKAAGDYLYLTIMNSKKGKLISYLISHGLPYEPVPNLFLPCIEK